MNVVLVAERDGESIVRELEMEVAVAGTKDVLGYRVPEETRKVARQKTHRNISKVAVDVAAEAIHRRKELIAEKLFDERGQCIHRALKFSRGESSGMVFLGFHSHGAGSNA